MTKYFKAASWDPLLQIITFGMIIFAFASIYSNPTLPTVVFFGALILIPSLFIIRGYSITSHKLIIHRLGWKKEFNIQDLIKAEVNSTALKEASRVLGNGGLFGWIGTFSNLDIGRFKAYATNRSKCVVIELEKKTLLITPDKPDEFVISIQALTKS